MSDTCRWLHEQLASLPLIRYPFDPNALPRDGVYVFYEDGETWGHGDPTPRIVRIGTHRNGNFRSRIADHFLRNEARQMLFSVSRPAPKDRSIFRKNLGRALLNRANDPYLEVWNFDFTTSASRATAGHRRDIEKERAIEAKVTHLLRTTFAFRYIAVDDQAERMGATGIESALIGTVASCPDCCPSLAWLGNHSPDARIRRSGLWLVQHLAAPALETQQRDLLITAIERTAQATF